MIWIIDFDYNVLTRDWQRPMAQQRDQPPESAVTPQKSENTDNEQNMSYGDPEDENYVQGTD